MRICFSSRLLHVFLLPGMRDHGNWSILCLMRLGPWVLQKRHWRTSLLHEARELQRSTSLHAFFLAWRTAAASDLETVQRFDHLLCQQDRLIALALHEFRRFGYLVTCASRADDIAFFQRVLRQGADNLQPPQARDLWKIIKRALPKYQQRRQGVDPLRLMRFEHEWQPHFEQLEAGRAVQPDDVLATVQALPDPQRQCILHQIPSLFEFEQVYVATKMVGHCGLIPSLLTFTTIMLLSWPCMPSLFCWKFGFGAKNRCSTKVGRWRFCQSVHALLLFSILEESYYCRQLRKESKIFCGSESSRF